MKVVVDLYQIKKWVDDSGEIVTTHEAEEAIIQLYNLKEAIDLAIDTAKKRIESEAIAYNPNFSTISTDNLKITYRAYGGRYTIEKQYQDELPEELIVREIKIKPNVKAIDNYLEENGGKLPLGLLETEREKQLSIKVLNEKV